VGDVLVAVDGTDVRGMGPRELQLYILQDARKRMRKKHKEYKKRGLARAKEPKENILIKISFERLDFGTSRHPAPAPTANARARINSLIETGRRLSETSKSSNRSSGHKQSTILELDGATRNALLVACNELQAACQGILNTLFCSLVVQALL